jgi:hypothetical protein
MNLKVQLVSGLFGSYISADCYINGEYFDFYTSTEGVRLINEWGIEVPMSISEYVDIEMQLRQQFEDKQ